MTKLFNAAVAEPIDLKILEAGAPQPDPPTTPCVAVIVCHGMGQQVPFETLDAVATAIADEHMGNEEDSNRAKRSVDVVLRFVHPTSSEKLLPCAEVTLKQEGQPDKSIHLYEAYWAPLTEGVIGYAQTVRHLLKAGFKGLSESCKKEFRRWMFGEDRKLPVDRDTFRLLALLLAILTPILILPLVVTFPQWGKSFETIKNISETHSVISAAFYIIAVAGVTILSYAIRNFIVQYMGDVIIYVSSNEVNEYWKIRDEIKQIGLSLAKVVYGATTPSSACKDSSSEAPQTSFLYSDVVVVGHSLGSVVAYDTLNAIINQDRLDKDKRKVVDRTEAFITLGSPLDKVAFLFRQKAKDAFTRDMLAAAHQPMILDYKNRPRWWINVFCKEDIISGSLEYYDDPDCANSEPRRVRNFVDPYSKPNPVSAHTGYWERPLTKSFLYLAATGSLRAMESSTFQHNSQRIEIRGIHK